MAQVCQSSNQCRSVSRHGVTTTDIRSGWKARLSRTNSPFGRRFERVSTGEARRQFDVPEAWRYWSLTLPISDFELADIALHIDVVNQELRFLEGLTRATSYEMANDTLTLLDANGVAVTEFE